MGSIPGPTRGTTTIASPACRGPAALFYYLPASTAQASRLDLGDLQGARFVLDSEPHDLDADRAARLRRYLEHGRPELAPARTEPAFFVG